MTITMRKTFALLKKELKSLIKNKNILFMCMIPVLFSIIYTNLIDESSQNHIMDKLQVLLLVVGMNLILVSSFVMAMAIAEEKENNTLRTLMLAGVSPLQFLMSKVVITFIITEIINIVIFYVVGFDPSYFGQYLILTSLVVVSMIELGAVIGILSPTQMSVGVVGMPVLMILWGIPMFAQTGKTVKKIAELLPLYNMNELFSKIYLGQDVKFFSVNIIIILIWIVITTVIFIYTFRKVNIDK